MHTLDTILNLAFSENYQEASVKLKQDEARLRKNAARREQRLLCGANKEQILALLRDANGRRRERTLSYEDVVACVRRARKCGWCAVGGGTVANAYKYPAWQTVCFVAVRSDKNIVLRIGLVSARKSSSLTNPFCGLSITASAQQFRDWADGLERMTA